MPSIALPVSLRGQLLYSVRVYTPPSSFTPADLFTSTEVGLWLDPSDTTTLFQDPNGITPVTSAGQSVRLALDKSKGLALGTELLTNGNFSSGTTGWTTIQGGATTAVVSGELEVTGNNTANFANVLQTNVAVSIGKLYRLQVTARRGTTTANVGIYTTIAPNADVLFTTSTTNQTLTAYFVPTSSTVNVGLRMLASSGNFTGTAYFDNVSLREVLGNHLFQSNTGQAPTYQIDGAGKHYLNFDGTDDWLSTDANNLVDPTAINAPGPDLIVNGDFSSATGWTIGTGMTINTTAGQLEMAAAASNTRATQAVGVTGRVYAITFTLVSRSAGAVRGYAGGGVAAGTGRTVPGTYTDYVICGTINADVGLQTVNATTAVVDNVSVRDVTYQTAQIFAGVRKELTAGAEAAGLVVETGTNVDSIAGTVGLVSANGGGANFSPRMRNSATTTISKLITGKAAPITGVISSTFDFSQASITDAIGVLYNNAAATTTDSAYTQGGGFTPQRVFVGRRGGSSVPLNGRIYGLVLRFGPTPSAQTISDMNNWMNGKTGAY